jgi:hypothetical protein
MEISFPILNSKKLVRAGLVPAIHTRSSRVGLWVAGTSPAMTKECEWGT